MPGVKLAGHLSYLFTELPLIDRFLAARDAGFQGVDLSNIAGFPLADVMTGMRRSGLPIVLTTASIGSFERQGPGMAALPGREEEFRAGCRAVLPYLEATGLHWVHLLSGTPGPDMPFELCYATYLANLRFALDLFEPRGVGVLVEQINTTDLRGYFMGDFALARRTVADLSAHRVQLLFDVYHLAMSGHDPVQAFRECRHEIAHVHIVDCPGRHEPGTGTIDFASLFRAAADTNYDGWFTAEYLPLGDTASGLGWMATLPGLRG
jgi:hydroxypyruvate isomerase